tara:strand:+ start:12457 stop:12609 length:153 start_codon:yes stop_codon:yes gene_type:complete
MVDAGEIKDNQTCPCSHLRHHGVTKAGRSRHVQVAEDTQHGTVGKVRGQR